MIAAKRRGFTLIELLAVMALMAVIGMMLTLLLRDTLEVERIQTASFQHMLERNALADQLRADVAAATKTLPAWGDYAAGKGTLILELAPARHVIYHWQGGSLQRLAFDGDKKAERVLPIADNQMRGEFVEEPGLVRLRLRPLQRGKPAEDRTVEIAAAVGGDTR